MRNMVEQGHTSGSSDTTVLSGVSSSSRLTRWISVPTPMTEPDGRLGHGPDDEVGGPDLVGHLHHLVGALGWTTTIPSGCSARKASTWAGRNRWWTEQWPFHSRRRGRLEGDVVQAALVPTGVPHRHVLGAVAQLEAGVPAEVLVGEEQDLVAPAPTVAVPSEGPGQDGPGVRRRAHHTAVAADEGLEGGRGVHVGDRHHPVDVGDGAEGLPGLLHRVDVGHVGHGAAGVEVGEDDLLVGAGEDVGRLGHEVDAAEHHVLGLGLVGGDAGQAERVAPGIGPRHHLVPLVVVAEDDHAGGPSAALARLIHVASWSGSAVV